GIAAALAAAGVVIGFYVADVLMSGPQAYRPPVGAAKTVELTLETVAAAGPTLAANPDWVSYFVRDASGRWRHTTVWSVPAHALVHVTVYQFDGASRLRNPFMARVRGTVGNVMQVDGKTLDVINPDDASHTFAVPALGLVVPLLAVPDDAKNQCGFVPCAAGFLAGFGGPMQTLGYMDGFLDVS